MRVENENKKGYLETMIVFYLLLLAGTIYLLGKLAIKIIENM